MMKKVLFLLITVSVALNAFGTAQMPDKIIYKGRTYNLYSNPLEGYFERYPDRRPSEGIVSTALWRGYIATFEVKDGRLMVLDVEAERFDGGAAGIS